MKIGQARVSTRDQNLVLQLDDLNKAGCETIYQKKVSGVSTSRSGLEWLRQQPLTGDTVYIYKLDRLGRSLRHLLTVVGDLQQLGVGLVFLIDATNTTSAQSRLMFNLWRNPSAS